MDYQLFIHLHFFFIDLSLLGFVGEHALYQSVKELLDNSVDAINSCTHNTLPQNYSIQISLQCFGDMYVYDDSVDRDKGLQLYVIKIQDSGTGITSIATNKHSQALFTDIFSTTKSSQQKTMLPDKTTTTASTGTFGVGLKGILVYNSQFDTPLYNIMEISSTTAASIYLESITIQYNDTNVHHQDQTRAQVQGNIQVISSSQAPKVDTTTNLDGTFDEDDTYGQGTQITVPVISPKDAFLGQFQRIIELVEEVSMLHNHIHCSLVALWEDMSLTVHGLPIDTAENMLHSTMNGLSIETFIDIPQQNEQAGYIQDIPSEYQIGSNYYDSNDQEI